MRTKAHVRLLTLLVLTLAFSLEPSAWLRAAPFGTAFTYQGRLNDGANPAGGIYDLRFRVWDSELNGTPASTTLTYTVTITNGLFTVLLDFGSAVFSGQSRWLEMSVSTNGAGVFTTLLPRQPMTATPYAITAASVSDSVPAGQISGTLSPAQLPATVVTNNSGNLSLSGAFTGTGAGLSNVNAAALGGIGASGFWQLGGNVVTSGKFIGSANNEAVEIRVNGKRALRLEPIHTGANNVLAGAQSNRLAFGVKGAVIAGGGVDNDGGYSYPNVVEADFGVIGGGSLNQIGDMSQGASIGGGFKNTIQAFAIRGVIGGGWENSIRGGRAMWDFASTIAGGGFNVVNSNASASVIAGGWENAIGTNAVYATIGGGRTNTVTAPHGTIAGGVYNRVSGGGAFIGGGGYDGDYSFTDLGNTASGMNSVVAGGTVNTAGGSRSSVASIVRITRTRGI